MGLEIIEYNYPNNSLKLFIKSYFRYCSMNKSPSGILLNKNIYQFSPTKA